jgi:hypothetical protein
MQVEFDGHWWPQVPQLFRSNARFAHEVPHMVRPALHVQAPFWQPMVAGLPPHWLPHVPQLLRSVARLRQLLPHSDWPAEQPHAPVVQTWLPAHWLPHEPQLLRLPWRSMQRPLHRPAPAVQKHAPPTHCSLTPHAWLQLLQFNASFCRFWHAPLHDASPTGHEVTHAPLAQTWPPTHATPQPPQFCTSSVSRTQRLPQFVVPLGHWHWLLKQLAPLPQTLPHAPQLLGSICVKVHASPHCACPGKHELRQPKPLHTWLEPHCVPHEPQLLVSLRETQAPLHSRKPVAQLQEPAVQLAPAHDVPHAPQFAGSVCVLMHAPLHDR